MGRDTLEQIDVARSLIDKYDVRINASVCPEDLHRVILLQDFAFVTTFGEMEDALASRKIASMLGVEGYVCFRLMPMIDSRLYV